MNDYIDVDYQDDSKRIRGGILYYSTSQVAQMLHETPSKIRYYSDFFSDILEIETVNKQRQYTKDNIDKLRYILDLKNDGITLKQIKQFCEEVDFDKNKPIVKETNPLGVQAIAKALMEEQSKQIMQMKEELKTELAETMKHEVLEKLETFLTNQKEFQMTGFEVLKEDIEKRVNNSVSEKLNGVNDTIKNELNNAVADIKEYLEVQYVSREEIENTNKKKSIFERLFKK